MKGTWKYVPLFVLAGLVSCSQGDMRPAQRDAQARLENAIADINHETDRLTRLASGATDTNKTKINYQLDQLNKSRKDLESEMDKVETTTEDSWDDFRREVDHTIDNANHVVNDAKIEARR